MAHMGIHAYMLYYIHQGGGISSTHQGICMYSKSSNHKKQQVGKLAGAVLDKLLHISREPKALNPKPYLKIIHAKP